MKNDIESSNAILMDDFKKPAYRSITINNIMYYSNLYKNKNSDFSLWFNNNLKNIHSSNKFNLQNFYEDNIEDIIKKFSFIDTNLLAGIVIYLFGSNILEKSQQGKGRPRSYELGYNENRIILLVENNGKKYIVKLSPFIGIIRKKELTDEYLLKNYTISKNYMNEAMIYLELNEGLKNTLYENNIIKIYSYKNNVKVESDKNFTVMYKDGGSVYITYLEKQITDKIRELSKNSDHNVQYIVLEYDNDFDTLEFFLDSTEDIDHIKEIPKDKILADLIIKIISFLIYTSNKFGFHHWDMHGKNLFIKKDGSNFKFYDFDQSSTIKNPNDFISEIILTDLFKDNPYLSDLYKTDLAKINDIGLIYDILRFINNFNPYNLGNETDPEYILFDPRIIKDSNIISLDKYLCIFYKKFEEKISVDTSKGIYFQMLQETTRELYQMKIGTVTILQEIKNILENINTSSLQIGGNNVYYLKYKKYKLKYLNLKNYPPVVM